MIKTLTKIIDDIIENMSEDIQLEIKQLASNRILEYSIAEYKRNLNIKTFLHRANSVCILDVFEPLTLSQTIDKKIISTISIEQLFKDFDKHELSKSESDRISREEEIRIKYRKYKNLKNPITKDKRVTESDKLYIHSSYQPKKNITIVGSAGSGKSTLTKYLLVKVVEEKLGVPILIEFRKLNDFEGDVLDYIYSEVFEFFNLSIDRKVTDKLLRTGKFYIILDGFDELLVNSYQKIAKSIELLTKKFSKCRYILTSRPYVNIDLLPSFVNYEIDNLSVDEISSFVKRQLPTQQIELISQIITSIEENSKSKYLVFLSNPLLLSMFIMTYQSYSVVPNKMSTFYRNVFETLFSTHDSLSKLMYSREKKSKLSKIGFQNFISYFSFISHFEQKYNFDSQYLSKRISEIKEKNLNYKFSDEDILHDLLVSVPLILKDGFNYSFLHRGIQEYFTALFVSNILDRRVKHQFYKSLFNNLNDTGNYVGEFYNLYEFLNEINEIDLQRFLVLPYLKLLVKSSIEETENFDQYFSNHKRFLKIIFNLHDRAKLWGLEVETANKYMMEILVEGNEYQPEYLFEEIKVKISEIEMKIDDRVKNEKFVVSVLNQFKD